MGPLSLGHVLGEAVLGHNIGVEEEGILLREAGTIAGGRARYAL